MPNPTNQKEEKEDEMDSDRIVSLMKTLPPEKMPWQKSNFELVDTGRWLLKVVGGPNTGANFLCKPPTPM